MSFQVTADKEMCIHAKKCNDINNLNVEQDGEVTISHYSSQWVSEKKNQLNHLQDYCDWFDENQESIQPRHVGVRAEHVINVLDDMSDLADNEKENLHHPSAVLEENPKD